MLNQTILVGRLTQDLNEELENIIDIDMTDFDFLSDTLFCIIVTGL